MLGGVPCTHGQLSMHIAGFDYWGSSRLDSEMCLVVVQSSMGCNCMHYIGSGIALVWLCLVVLKNTGVEGSQGRTIK